MSDAQAQQPYPWQRQLWESLMARSVAGRLPPALLLSGYPPPGHYAGYKIAVIPPAEGMNIAAANSLLKTLEEPPAKTVLLLVSSQPSRLLPTVRSRCQHVAFATPPREISLAWLAESIT